MYVSPSTYTAVQSQKVVTNYFLSEPLLPLVLQINNPLTAKLFNMNFPPLEVVSRLRDPQLQVSENYSDLTNWRSTLDVIFYLHHI